MVTRILGLIKWFILKNNALDADLIKFNLLPIETLVADAWFTFSHSPYLFYPLLSHCTKCLNFHLITATTLTSISTFDTVHQLGKKNT